MSDWQPIATAPIDYGIRILGYGNMPKTHPPQPVRMIRRALQFDRMAVNELYPWKPCWRTDTAKIVEPTHWMLLPAGPFHNGTTTRRTPPS